MDIHEIAEIIAPKGDPALRLRQGTVESVAADGTISVTIAGSTTVVTGVRCLAHVCPKVGAGIWLVERNRDLFAIGTMTPTGPAHVDVRRLTTQSIASGVDTVVNFLAGADVQADTHGMFDIAAPSQLTVRVPGIYLFEWAVAFPANGTGLRSSWVAVGGTYHGRDQRPATSVGTNVVPGAVTVACALSAVVQLYVRQSSGSNLDSDTTDYTPRLRATWLRPLTT